MTPEQQLRHYLVQIGLPIERVEEETMPNGVQGYIVRYRELAMPFADVAAAIQRLPTYRTIGMWTIGTLFVTFTTGQFHMPVRHLDRARTLQRGTIQ